MRVILITVGMHTKLCIASLAISPCNSKTICNTTLILLQNKALGTWKSLMQEYGILKMCYCLVFANRVTYTQKMYVTRQSRAPLCKMYLLFYAGSVLCVKVVYLSYIAVKFWQL